MTAPREIFFSAPPVMGALLDTSPRMQTPTPTPEPPISTVTARTFEAEVLASPVPVLLDFTTTWCGPCQKLEPILKALATENVGRVRVAKIDGDDEGEIASRYKVRAFPTIIAFSGGKEIGRHVGLTHKARLLSLLERAGA